ncbi:MAG: PQQ-dependent dehydrogenase, methanol/ethanol family [Gemmatimonadota bacterium]
MTLRRPTRSSRPSWIAPVMLGLLLAAAPTPSAAQVDEARIDRADPSEWLSYGRDYAETHYSPLARITTDNVGQLREAWSFELPRGGARPEATPLVADGVLYATGPNSYVFAVDARTGRLLWQWDPGIPEEEQGGPSVCCGNVNRGVAVYGDKVYVGVLDGRLVALNRATGIVEWAVQTTPRDSDYSITQAPRVVAGNVIIGNSGAEYGVRGYVSAYDAETGEMRWRWHTVPGDPALGFENEAMRVAAETWTGEWWVVGGGGTVWDGMAYDPRLGLLYIGTGNGAPWNRDERSPGGGDNLYLSSIVALRAATGEYVWHYQTTPGDDWDYTAVQPMMLLDLTIEGRQRAVIVQAPKNGFFYVIDRITGEFISASSFADDVTWAYGIDQETGRPIETPEARYGMNARGVWLSPGPGGAANWRPFAWNPGTGLVYLPMQNSNSWYDRVTVEYRQGQWNTGTARGPDVVRPERPAIRGPAGALKAWDPVANAEVWRMETAGVNGGALSTGGNLVFWGTLNRLVALDARSGQQLWETPIGDQPATPMTYELDGRQYVSILAGNSPPRLQTFMLP